MPEAGETRVVWLDDQNEIGMTFCWVPPGEFRMGSRNGHSDEQPLHKVVLRDGFWLGQTPVTQRQFTVCFLEDVCGFPDRDDHPAEDVTWHEARRYCQWLNQHRLDDPGWLADLPTESLWEYACRAGTETDYCTGDGEHSLAKAGWYGNNADGTTHPVGQRIANAFGLYDLHGNVKEWCRDLWREGAYRYLADNRIEPVRATEFVDESEIDDRVIRGGSWLDLEPGFCRSAYRFWGLPGSAVLGKGFRVGLFPGPSCPVK